MKPLRTALLLLTAALWLAGCSTPASRIKKNPELFASFPPEIQEKVRAGKVEPGFNKDMVSIALGQPDRTYTRTTEGGTADVWAFVDYRYTYEQQMVQGTFNYRDDKGRMRTAHDNVWVNVENRTEYEKMRVEFRNNLVIAVEQVDN
ncbi:MAG: hypothetical protein U1F77_11160 [Kiritimatiellia bacterium]